MHPPHPRLGWHVGLFLTLESSEPSGKRLWDGVLKQHFQDIKRHNSLPLVEAEQGQFGFNYF